VLAAAKKSGQVWVRTCSRTATKKKSGIARGSCDPYGNAFRKRTGLGPQFASTTNRIQPNKINRNEQALFGSKKTEDKFGRAVCCAIEHRGNLKPYKTEKPMSGVLESGSGTCPSTPQMFTQKAT
jgi:hypothetical protein